MKISALISGGKDSLYSTYLANKEHEISVLVAMKSKNPESYMFHVPGIDIVKLQAESMNIPLIFKETDGIKEKELEDLKQALIEAKEKYNIKGVVSGAIFSEYQKSRIDKLCKELELKSITPIWKIKTDKLWNDIIEAGFEIIIIAVAAGDLTKEWLGKKIDKEIIEKLLKLEISPIGEGGEFETLVLNCPMFKQKIEIIDSEIKWDNKTSSGELIIKEAKLETKEY